MKRKWLIRLGIVGGVLLLFVFAAVLAGKYWFIPSLLRQQISAALGVRWDGKLAIAGIQFNWTGPLYLRRVELRDAAGREWLRAASVKLTMRNWPGLHPVLCEVEVEDLALQGYFAGGALQIPLKPAPPDKGKTESVDLRTVTIRNMSIGIIAEASTSATWHDIQLTVRRDKQSHRIDLKRTPNEPGEELSVSGTVEGESLAADLALVMKHAVTREEGTAIFAALNAPFFSQAGGRIDAKVDLRGCLAALSAVRPSGTIALTDCSASFPHGPLLSGLSAEVRFDDRAPPGAVAEASAALCKGQAKAALSANALDDGTIRYRCRVDADNVNFDEFVKALSGSQTTRRGQLQFIGATDGHTGDRDGPVVKGYAYLKDAGLADVPLLSGLFHVAGLTQLEALQATDVEAAFTMKGLVVTLSQARLANAVAAVDVEPGGQVDIGKHSLDLYAIVAPIKQLHDVLASIPLVKLVVRLQDRLTRVHILGDWNAPPAGLISKKPLQDIAEGTVDFLRGVVSSGGRIGKSLYKEFGERFDP